MNAAVICLLSLIVFAFGYFVYSAHLARHVFQLRDDVHSWGFFGYHDPCAPPAYLGWLR